jgi:hypothetical protein
MSDQYAYIYPGEKLYVLVAEVNGSKDYTHVVQIDFPTVEHRGDTIINGEKSPVVNAQYDLLEANDAANLQAYSDNNTVLGATRRSTKKKVARAASE